MKRAIAMVAVSLSAAAFLACDNNPVEQGDGPQLTLSADSVTVDVGASASVLSRDTRALARPDFGGPATAADRALFAYDANAPLNLTRSSKPRTSGVERNAISFDGPLV